MIYDPSLEIRFLFISGIFCVIMNFLAIYMIIFKAGNIGTYRYYLLYFQTVSFAVDLHVTVLVVPTIHFPALIGVSHGIYTNFLSLKTHYQINILFTLIVLQISALLSSFIRKHQSVAMIGQKNIISSEWKYLMKVLLHFPALIVAVFFGLSNLEKSEERKLVVKEFPQFLPLLSLPNVEVYSTESIFLRCTLTAMILTFAVFSLTFLFLYFQIIQMLHSHRQFMAARTYAKHISAVLSLVTQLIVLIIWIVIPIGLLLLVALLRVEGVEAYCNILICLFSTHSITSTLVMMFTFPAFRRIICCQEKPLFSPGTTIHPSRRTPKPT